MRIHTLSLLAALASVGVAAAATGGPTALAAPAAPAATGQPNMVFILLDDFSSELVQYMDGLEDMQQHGVSFSSFVTSDPLCCPSRASILTGKYPHNTGVLNNQWPNGGVSSFLEQGNEDGTIGVYLDSAGYRTGFMGKFLNGYKPSGAGGHHGEPEHPPMYVPPGWDEWFASGAAYQEFNYTMVDSRDGDASVVRYDGNDEADYLTDVLADRAVDFIDRNAADPFFLMVTPFATHGNVGNEPDPEGKTGPNNPPAPRDRPDRPTRPADWAPPEFAGGDCGAPVDGGCDDVAFPDPSWEGNFNKVPRNPPAWYGKRPKPLSTKKLNKLEQAHLQRVQMTQAVDDLIDDVRAELETAGVADDTYIVLAADNGYHLGQHAIGKGKSTAYESDVVTPLVVLPPGGFDAPQTVDTLIQNTDFLPTFLTLAAQTVPLDVDGRSFAWALDGTPVPPSPRQGAIVEFNGEEEQKGRGFDPDIEQGDGLTPPKYFALRTDSYLYVDYSVLDGTTPPKKQAEFYNLTVDPDEMNNVYRGLSKDFKAALNTKLNDYAKCRALVCVVEGVTVPQL